MSEHSNPFVEAIEREDEMEERARLLALAVRADREFRERARRWLAEYDAAGPFKQFILRQMNNIADIEAVASEEEGAFEGLVRLGHDLRDARRALEG